jgi:tetratricopeptide (TPR) repeat protein
VRQVAHGPVRRGAFALHLAGLAAAVFVAACAHAPWVGDPSAEPPKVCGANNPLVVLRPHLAPGYVEPTAQHPAASLPYLERVKALYCLGLYVPALEVLQEDALGQPRDRALADATLDPPEPKPLAADRMPGLRWLVYIHRRFPGWDRIGPMVAAVARVDLDRPEVADVRDDLYLLAGRSQYQQGRFAEALALLRAIPTSSPLRLQASLVEGATHVRTGAQDQALAAFDKALRAAPAAGDAKRAPDRALAILSIARVQSGLGQLEAASRHYQAVPPTSPYWADAALEGARTRYRMEDRPGTRARVQPLQARSREVAPDTMAEALVLAATVGSQTKDVERILTQISGPYVAMYMEARKLLQSPPDALYNIAFSVRAGGALPAPGATEVVRALLADVPVADRFEELDEIERESARSAALGDAWVGSGEEAAVSDALASRRRASAQEAGEQFKRRLQRFADRLVVQIKEAIGIQMNLNSGYGDERGELE